MGLVLGGGGARGLCHIGVLRVLEELDIHPDVVSGTSMGGLVGAFVAAGYDAAELEEIATDLRWRSMISWSPLSGRLLSTRAFMHWLEGLLPPTFEELELPLVLTATNLTDGRIFYARSGDLYRALRATTAYPGAIEPVRVGEDLMVDGGLLNQIPVDGALLHGVRRVLAVNATPLTELDGSEDGGRLRISALESFREVMRAVDVMQAQLTMSRLSFYPPDLLLDPQIEGMEITDFHRARHAIAAGARAALDRREELARIFGRGAVEEVSDATEPVPPDARETTAPR
ncbi:patatin [Ornithinimicrobium avium]|uniref:Patatin n=2 Tax=Ornithinimicrobium avium TaxID=2283195 RepID=A0A345NSM6_9MICO|nr:patatin [Ornithinimicrobium avium]